jgi:hypothetical protein
MARLYTTDEIIELIKLNDALPEDAGSFQDSDYLKLMNQEMMVGLLPQMLKVHEEYYTYEHQIPLVSGTSSYAIPHRATGSKLRDLRWVDNNSSYNNRLTRYNIEDVGPDNSYYSTDRYTNGFYIKNNTINLINTTISSGTLGMMIFLRPNEFVLSSRGCTIAAIDTDTGVITVDSVPTHFGTKIDAGNTELFDFISKNSPYKIRKFDVEASAVDSTLKTITFTASDLPSDLVVGDTICWEEETFVPQLPLEVVPLLVQGTAIRCLKTIGDYGAATAELEVLQQMKQDLQILIDNRTEGNPQKVINRNSLLRGSRLY